MSYLGWESYFYSLLVMCFVLAGVCSSSHKALFETSVVLISFWCSFNDSQMPFKKNSCLRIILTNINQNSLAYMSSLCPGLSYALHVTQERLFHSVWGRGSHLLFLSSRLERNHFASPWGQFHHHHHNSLPLFSFTELSIIWMIHKCIISWFPQRVSDLPRYGVFSRLYS